MQFSSHIFRTDAYMEKSYGLGLMKIYYMLPLVVDATLHLPGFLLLLLG